MLTRAQCSSGKGAHGSSPSSFPGCSVPISGSDHRLLYLRSSGGCVSQQEPPNHSNLGRNWVQLSRDVSVSSCTGFSWVVCLFFCYRCRLLLTKARAHISKGGGREAILKDTVIYSENTKSEPRAEALLSIF